MKHSASKMPDRSPILEERTARYTTMSLYQTLLIALLIAPQAALHAVEPASVELNGQQCIRVNHRPFFPIGIYSASTADFPSLAEAGFNVVHRSREVTDTFPYCFPGHAPIQFRKLRVPELP